ncbi:M23 family metallopeptidase [Actinokineospora terrae]|uniref:Peptidase family M23 n=1 Tax=Actinokineospora terrae TaxID=155974 RepID=A0A1H9QBL4_9PSEU|nr:peptidoglycan DD-metalloendopeptidase family protein [Actinokineospora terrae]SER57223.1 Peptidase family M23 [Actinokineospora terrae]
MHSYLRKLVSPILCVLLLPFAWVDPVVAAQAPLFSLPLVPARPVSRPFTAPAHPYGAGHRGVDLPGAVGEPVHAAADGVVVFAGVVVDRSVVSIQHRGGLRTTYEPVVPEVAGGTRVRRGDVLGRLGAGHPGCAVAACLHWGLRRGREYLDPMVAVHRPRVRLLPLD